MQLTAVLLLTAVLSATAAGRAQNISYSGRQVSVKKILQDVNRQTGIVFFHEAGLLDETRPIDISAKEMTLKDFMTAVLQHEALQFIVEEQTVIITRKSPAPTIIKILAPPLITVRGRVVNENGEPVVASVTIKGTTRGTSADNNGWFELDNVDADAVLQISGTSIEPKEVKVEGKNELVIKVTLRVVLEEEVVVNKGYYVERKQLSTGNVAKVTSKDIERQPVTNFMSAIQGRMAGVNIKQSSGVPGGAISIEIRGRNSLRADGNSPLYIIDGTPYSSQRMDQLTSQTMQDGGSPLSGINPADIESIEVLKDADATAIYGSRGANGVVLITTKRGKSGKTEFSLNAYTGAGKVTRTVKLMNTEQYLEMRKEAFANDNIVPTIANAPDLLLYDQNSYTDFQKELIGGTAGIQSVQAGVSGGTSQSSFLLSGNYTSEKTVFPGDYRNKRAAVHVNIDHRSTDNKFGVTFSGNYVIDNNNLPYTDLTSRALQLPPNSPALRKENGDLNWEFNIDNPLAYTVAAYSAKRNTLTAASTWSYKFLPGFELKTVLGFTDNTMTEGKSAPSNMYNPSRGITEASSGYQLNNANQRSWSIEPQLAWVKKIARSSVSVMTGAAFQQMQSTILVNLGQGYTSNSLLSNLLMASVQRIQNHQNTEYRYNGVWGRLNYNYADKYIVNLTGRRDGSSRFGPGKRFGNFGAVGAAWLFGKEDFVSASLPFLSSGKFRASYGTSGNDQIGDYQYINTYRSSGNNYQGIIGLQPSQLFNPDFSWEVNRKFEAAIETGFINDRVFLSAAFFSNISSNQLVGIPLPTTTGFSSVQANLDATVKNSGLEVELRTENLRKVNLRWSTSWNFSLLRNKLVSFPNLEASTYATQYVVGEPLSVRRIYTYLGVNSQTGLYEYVDYNGDGTISSVDDRKEIISLMPAWYGGVVNNIVYKNLEIDFLFQFVKQNGFTQYGSWSYTAGQFSNQPVERIERWRKPGDNSPLQRYTSSYGAAYNADRLYVTRFGFADASFIRLKNLSVSYRLPQRWMKQGSCKIYFQAQNLFTLTQFKGPDPENQLIYALPPIKMMTAGIRLSY